MPFGLVIVGGGPGGLAPLFAAASGGTLQRLLAEGIVVVERSSSLNAGSLQNYCIHSDSPAEAFLDILARSTEPELRSLLLHPVAKRVEQLRGQTVPLTLASQLLQLAAEKLGTIIESSSRGAVLLNTVVVSIRRRDHDQWELRTRHLHSGQERVHLTRSVHLATGAEQPTKRLLEEPVAGKPLLPRFEDKLIQSGELFSHSGLEIVKQRLAGISEPRIVIVGGSTSAGTAAVHLLESSSIQFAAGGVTLMHRSPLRIFYSSVEEAKADGYLDFQPSDVCHLSGRVYRLSGFRFKSKELLRNVFGLSKAAPDLRFRLFEINGNEAEAQQLLENADLIVAALGYRPRMCTVLDQDGEALELHSPHAGDWAMVDQQCRVLDKEKRALSGLFAMGLAIGPAASHELGGEANFKGQVNSLWLWQNTLGVRVAEQVQARCEVASIPLIRPSPPSLSEHIADLQAIERARIYSNFGPVNERFERELVDSVFDGTGHCVTTCNATLAMMLAIRNAIGDGARTKQYALMPSFTFAAAAQAALWCGLTPLYCDIDPRTWLPSHSSENSLLKKYDGQIAVIVPNATFGNNLDLERYAALSEATGVPVVVDAAASLGSLDGRGDAFGKGSPLPIIFSMHATKTFATGEGGILYSGDKQLIDRLQIMSSFGFGEPRNATMLGLNAKMSEVAALTALLALRELPARINQQQETLRTYEQAWAGSMERQHTCGMRQVRNFESVLLPPQLTSCRPHILEAMRQRGIGIGCYFSPHLADQPYLREHSVASSLEVTEDVSSRIISLPFFSGIKPEEVRYIASSLMETLETAGLALSA